MLVCPCIAGGEPDEQEQLCPADCSEAHLLCKRAFSTLTSWASRCKTSQKRQEEGRRVLDLWGGKALLHGGALSSVSSWSGSSSDILAEGVFENWSLTL